MESGEGLKFEAQKSQPKVERVTITDLRPVTPERGGSVLVLQRNAKDKDNRKLPKDSPDFGKLDAGEPEATQAQSKEFFDQIFAELTPEERSTVDILIVGADTTLNMPDGRTSPHKRGFDTAEHVLTGVQDAMKEFSVAQAQLLNKLGKPIELTSGRLKDLKMMEDSPEFVQFLVNKYGSGQEFWNAYESDVEKETRTRMKAEGPVEIADRVGQYMGTLDNAMKLYHQSHPGRRAIVWAVSHYDSISPFLKQKVTGQPLEDYLPVDNRGGVVFNIKPSGESSTQVQGQSYQVNLAK
ncbi:hypothetical protein A2631_00780 [Candidatus Daviesbacteria bacterium RIFCSPHIGHO2_01_FULL_44_29]|uniref:Uncharacterized protein n=1 Tax=Candidatus Daviesbacteria bacterium RIFCSPHIGHO2_02_FULL_43_12 TaxID=1797776 RepID=A0A1F5KHH5_9BACT|nr:MAG: hypothetical protein A2631_00780 [Candidatus Daviesbacteria bacterium RIFCSPHIGHO2_01_FULL_44_29]OGE39376.1 MAG: hypothetical protein A3E86_01640 [Candidatus Daviesbacteria bacterium RIFCSPHIGHO2_12_FULL_47_45]OGE40255.1 MAG: hypothetical protein A3D25_05245 [Candidatus Daviesbacteria bacterium RIFCSPHIGHO2_02_FULL_43_12]OGE69054.1 MAG: hypothetical protein A3B55_02325 [Candidatus Daviesbacteria bacterium RIFCSPLOWO2_01_FULL_43_15]